MEVTRKIIATIAFPFIAGSGGNRLVGDLKKQCEEAGLEGDLPKMGPHATVIPPFYCTEEELQLSAILMRAMWKLNPGPVFVTGKAVAAFNPPEESNPMTAIYLEVEIASQYVEFIERHKQGWPLPFVSRTRLSNPSDRVWVPHITILEGRDLHRKAEPLLLKLTEYARDKQIQFLEPHVFRKENEGDSSFWQKVLT